MILFWVLTFIFLSTVLQDKVYATIKVDNEFSLSYPLKFKINTPAWQDKSFGKVSVNAINNFVDITYKEFISKKSGISFKYPAIFNANEQDFTGGEILFHVDLISKDLYYHGFVEVWQLNVSLEKFLSSSLRTSTLGFVNFSKKNITSNNLTGILWKYNVKGSGNKEFKCLEAFLIKDSKMYRVSLFIPSEKYSNMNYDIFMKIVNSLKILN